MKNGRARSISAFLRSDAASHGTWVDFKKDNQPLLARAAQDLANGRRLLALHRLAMAEVGLATGAYLSARPADQHQNMARFEAEWARMGSVLHGDLGSPSAVLAGVQPAALQALGEAAIPQVRAYYVASLDYGRSTTPADGLFGDVSAVPTLLVFDGQGRTADAYFGAPPTLHKEAEAKLASLLK